jgi:molybdopterin synthase catalytic subunit
VKASGFRLIRESIDPESLKRALAAASAGAYVGFEGWIRDHNEGGAVSALEYEAHEAIAVKEGEAILSAAREKFDVIEVACVHRVGKLAIGECAVWVGVSAAHRGAAFDACRYVIDEIKHRLPIWKKEHYRDGQTGWINCADPSLGAAASRR